MIEVMTMIEEGGEDQVMRMMRELAILIKSEPKPWKPGRAVRPGRR